MKVKLNQKAVALAAAGLVLLSGATVTSLAAWTDTEWVNGGVGTTPTVASSKFDVEQNVTTDPTTGWTNNTASPGGVVDFGALAKTLTPNTSVVGFVRLRTIAGSVGGDVVLNHATSTGSAAFLAALRFGAWLHPDASTCNAAHYGDAVYTNLVPDLSTIGTDSAVHFTLSPSVSATVAGTEQTVCFRLTFPALTDPTDKSLQGQAADPVWQFNAISN
jgi:predicted ribosomally synthesized peptide with SipW-like signal peptide